MQEDPYIWMENLEDPRVKDFISRENARFIKFVGELPEKLRPKVRKYYYMPSIIHAQVANDYYFILRQKGSIYALDKFTRDGKKDRIIDSKSLGKNVLITYFVVDTTHNVLAYYYSIAGSDLETVKIIDLRNGETIDKLFGSIGNITFLGRDKYYYSRLFRTEHTPDGVAPPAMRIFLRESGEEELVFGRGLPTNHFISMDKSVDRKNMIIGVYFGWTRGMMFGGNLKDPASWQLIYDAKDNYIKPIGCYNGSYYLIPYDGEGYGRIIRVGKDGVETIVSGWKYPLRHAGMTSRNIYAEYLVDASSILKIFDLEGSLVDVYKPENPSTIGILDTTPDTCLISMQTFWIPYRLIEFKGTKKRELNRLEIKGEFEVEEKFVESLDGTNIHFFIFKRREAKSRNVLIFGYGGFGISLSPTFLKGLMPFVMDGGIYVEANIRGGSEYGEKWHQDGMLDKKQNVFDDFASIIKFFKERGYRVAILGRSNGGLLVGATITQRPEIVDVAIMGYPVLDMLRFHKLYIGKAWIPEYGDPENPEHRKFLLKYSPYHNISKDKKYPPTMVYTGLHDDRVHPDHALKFVAKMRELDAPIFLRVETKSGHIGADPETRIEEIADILAFLYLHLSINS